MRAIESGLASLKPLEEVNMRKLFVTAAAVAALLAGGALTTHSDAMTHAKSTGAHAAVHSVKGVKYLRSGRHHRHHRHVWMKRHHHKHVR